MMFILCYDVETVIFVSYLLAIQSSLWRGIKGMTKDRDRNLMFFVSESQFMF